VSDRPAPVGILGGTFDPIHFGHLRLAQELAEQCGLAEVRLIPTGTPPHRAAPATPATHRLAMTRLAARGNPLLAVDDREVRRQGLCYTVDTLTELRATLGADASLCLLLGADAFRGLAAWSRWRQVFALAHVVVAARPGYGLDEATLAAEVAGELEMRRVSDAAPLARAAAGTILVAEIPGLTISATDIRTRLATGRSARYLIPDAVLDYIALHQLYGDQ